jgi:hypothetical protein
MIDKNAGAAEICWNCTKLYAAPSAGGLYLGSAENAARPEQLKAVGITHAVHMCVDARPELLDNDDVLLKDVLRIVITDSVCTITQARSQWRAFQAKEVGALLILNW